MHDTASKHSDNRQLVINASSNAGVMFVKIVVVFVASPLLVHGLGASHYGIWMFVSSITAYFALGDLGVKSAIVRYVARYDGLNDHEGMNRVINTSSAILALVGMVILLITAVIAWTWRTPAAVATELSNEARWFFVLSGTSVAVLLQVSVPQSILAGLGRFPERNAISAVSLTLRHIVLVGVVWCGGSLIAVGAVTLCWCLLDFGALIWAVRRVFPHGSYSWRHIDHDMLKEVSGYGLNVAAGDLAFLAIGQSAPLIIGAVLLSSEAVTHYSIGASLQGYALSILAMIVFVLTPAVSKWQATGNVHAISAVLVHTTRYALYFITPIEIGLLVFGHAFLSLWMGKGYAQAGYPTLVILSGPLVLSAIGMIASRVLGGLGEVRAQAKLTALQAVLTITLGIGFVTSFGIEGVAWGASLALACVVPLTTFLACRRVQLSILALLQQTIWGPLLASTCAALVWLFATYWLPIDSWAMLIGIGIAGMVPYFLVALALEPQVRRLAGSTAKYYVNVLSTTIGMALNWIGLGKY